MPQWIEFLIKVEAVYKEQILPSSVSSHLAAHSRQPQTANAEGAPCWLDLGLCNRLGSPTAHSGQAQTTNAKRAPLLAGLRSLLQPGFPNLFKSKLQRGRRRLYQKLSVAVTNYIISVHDCKIYTINAVFGFTKKVLVGYVSILPYFGSASYLYQRMFMGLNISPSICQSYKNAILECLQSRKHCEAIMDDLLLFTTPKRAHMAKLEDSLKALLKNGLKISPKKCQLFKTELQYIGDVIFIKDRKVCVKPWGSRLEAIQKLQMLMTPKGCRSLAGMGNF